MSAIAQVPSTVEEYVYNNSIQYISKTLAYTEEKGAFLLPFKFPEENYPQAAMDVPNQSLPHFDAERILNAVDYRNRVEETT